MKLKKIILMLTFILLISCTLQDIEFKSPFQKQAKIEEFSEYQTGKQGLAIRFAEEAVQTKVRETSLFDLVFELQNKGFSDITRGLYKLITEEQYIRTERPQGVFLLKGKSPYNPMGEIKRINFPAKAGLIDQEQIYEFPVKTTLVACYAYETIATTGICIDPDVKGIKKDKACEMEEISLSDGQGAPVAVTKIIPRMEFTERGAVPTFEIYIENAGEGQVISENYIENACGSKPRTNIQDYNKAEIEVILSDKILTCEPSALEIKKYKETRIYCEQKTTTQRSAAYTAPLQIKINYGYMTSGYGDITIQKKG